MIANGFDEEEVSAGLTAGRATQDNHSRKLLKQLAFVKVARLLRCMGTAAPTARAFLFRLLACIFHGWRTTRGGIPTGIRRTFFVYSARPRPALAVSIP
jgi:hypothetical protein